MNIREAIVPILGVMCSLPPLHTQAQGGKDITTQPLAWFCYVNTTKFNHHWSLGVDVQERRFMDPDAQHQFVARAHAIRSMGNGWEVRAGGCFFFQSPNDPSSTSTLVVPELRPHIDLNHSNRSGNWRISHRYRVEARFFHDVTDGELSGGYAFGNYRLRYQFGVEVPLFKQEQDGGVVERMYLRVSDEVMLNAGSNVVLNTFDQNRIGIGVAYWTSPSFSFELGYVHLFQQRATGSEFYERHILRVAFVQRIDLSMKKAQQ